MARQNKTNAARTRTLERETKAFELRKMGASYTQIGRSLKISPPGAHKLVTAVFKRLESDLAETVPTVRRMEVERLDEMLLSIWPSVKNGELDAINTALRISDRRGKLLGLDTTKVEVSGADGKRIPIEIIDLCMARGGK